MNTCSFTFISLRTGFPCRSTGIERTWDYLKREFGRNSDGLPDAKYYETLGPGPQLFAVVNDQVYYHHDNKWSAYITATDISYGIVNIED